MVERRNLDRFERAIPIRFSMASENYDVEHDAVTQDWSTHGIRIGTAVRLSQGEQLLVLSHGGTPSAIPARVTWVGRNEINSEGTAGVELLYSLPV